MAKYEEDTIGVENNLDDINSRYDWASDRLKQSFEKEKKKNGARANQNFLDKCKGMEVCT